MGQRDQQGKQRQQQIQQRRRHSPLTQFKEPPLWFFPAASHLNSDAQIQLLKDAVMSFGGTQDPTATYPKRLTIKVLERYELTEFDAPGFLFLTGNMRVTITHLRFPVHSVTNKAQT